METHSVAFRVTGVSLPGGALPSGAEFLERQARGFSDIDRALHKLVHSFIHYISYSLSHVFSKS